MRLDAMNAVDDKSQGHIPAPPPVLSRRDYQLRSPALLLRGGESPSPGGGEGKMVSPSPRQPWQIPLRSVITFCRLYPNECDVVVTPTSGVEMA